MSYLNPGRMGLIGAPTYPMLRDATQATLLELLDANKIPYEHNKAENTLAMRDTGSKILFRPVEEFERLRGTNLAWFGLDELTYTQEGAWLRLEGRLRDPKAQRLCGFAVWTPKGFDWVYRRFLGSAKQGYQAVIAKPFENRHLLEQIPDYYERLRTSYDQTFYQQEVLGEYLSLDGARAYSAFDRKTHVTDLQADPRLPLRWALDFNVDPMSSVIAQITRDGTALALDEIVIRNATTGQACEEFLKRYGNHPAGVIVYGDASGYQRQTTGMSDYDMIQECFRANGSIDSQYRTSHSNPPVRERVNLMNARLRSAAGDIGLLVDPKCAELIQDFEQVAYKADTGQIDKERDRRRTHMSDALGYLLCEECRPKRAIGERRERLL